MLFFNTKTNEYPRYQGDMELLGWNPGEPLPSDWVEVENNDPVYNPETQRIVEALPEFIDGKYVRKFIVTDISPEELEAIRVRLAKEELPYA